MPIVQMALLAAATILLLAPSSAGATTAQEEGQGAQVLRELEAGKVECGDLSGEDFDHLGEYVMGRMFASSGSHEAMDEVMARMMGSGSETRVHEAMGRRFAGCGGGQLPAGFGRMMGAIGAMGMMGGGMMGGAPGNPGAFGPFGTMMGGDWNESGGGSNFDGPSAAAAIGMMAVLIAAVGLAVFFLARRGPRSPSETLKQRYANGELSVEDFEERMRLLEGK